MEDVKREFIDRYNFIFNNVDIILMPLVKEKSDGSLYIDVSEEFLNDLETFLLGDIPYNETSFYRIISYDSMDDLVRARCKLIRDSIEELRTRKNIENYGIKTVFQIARNFILGQKNINIEKKLLAIDEYFRFNRYNNNSLILKGGAILGYEDLGVFCEKLGNYDKPYIFNRSSLSGSKFIDFIADSSNHYENNNSIFTEEEKQDVYLMNHPGSIPWNGRVLKRVTN